MKLLLIVKELLYRAYADIQRVITLYTKPALPGRIVEDEKQELYICLADDIEEIAVLFYEKCIDSTISEELHKISILNRSIGGKAKIAIRALQLVFITSKSADYISEHDSNLLIEYLMRSTLEQRETLHCHDLYQCYMKLGASVSKKHIYYFSVDIAKYIFGFESDGYPSSFPCLSSYISSGIPRDILTRSDLTHIALVLQSVVPSLKVATDLAVEYCLNIENRITTEE